MKLTIPALIALSLSACAHYNHPDKPSQPVPADGEAAPIVPATENTSGRSNGIDDSQDSAAMTPPSTPPEPIAPKQ